MAHIKHGVNAKSDPNFKPDPNARKVYDEKKGVYRTVIAATGDRISTKEGEGPSHRET